MPNGLLAHLAGRGLLTWLLLRLSAAAVLAAARLPAFALGAAATLWLVVLTAVVAYGETHRQGESVLLANLGVGPTVQGTLFLVPPALCEVAVSLARASA